VPKYFIDEPHCHPSRFFSVLFALLAALTAPHIPHVLEVPAQKTVAILDIKSD